MSKFIPVEPEKWAEMVKAQAENARLQAEVERLQMEQKIKAIPVEARLVDRIAELKAEVERLQSIHSIDSIGIEQLKAQVERLTKAGNLICRMAGNNQVINRHWKTAKKGVQS